MGNNVSVDDITSCVCVRNEIDRRLNLNNVSKPIVSPGIPSQLIVRVVAENGNALNDRILSECNSIIEEDECDPLLCTTFQIPPSLKARLPHSSVESLDYISLFSGHEPVHPLPSKVEFLTENLNLTLQSKSHLDDLKLICVSILKIATENSKIGYQFSCANIDLSLLPTSPSLIIPQTKSTFNNLEYDNDFISKESSQCSRSASGALFLKRFIESSNRRGSNFTTPMFPHSSVHREQSQHEVNNSEFQIIKITNQTSDNDILSKNKTHSTIIDAHSPNISSIPRRKYASTTSLLPESLYSWNWVLRFASFIHSSPASNFKCELDIRSNEFVETVKKAFNRLHAEWIDQFCECLGFALTVATARAGGQLASCWFIDHPLPVVIRSNNLLAACPPSSPLRASLNAESALNNISFKQEIYDANLIRSPLKSDPLAHLDADDDYTLNYLVSADPEGLRVSPPALSVGEKFLTPTNNNLGLNVSSPPARVVHINDANNSTRNNKLHLHNKNQKSPRNTKCCLVARQPPPSATFSPAIPLSPIPPPPLLSSLPRSNPHVSKHIMQRHRDSATDSMTGSPIHSFAHLRHRAIPQLGVSPMSLEAPSKAAPFLQPPVHIMQQPLRAMGGGISQNKTPPTQQPLGYFKGAGGAQTPVALSPPMAVYWGDEKQGVRRSDVNHAKHDKFDVVSQLLSESERSSRLCRSIYGSDSGPVTLAGGIALLVEKTNSKKSNNLTPKSSKSDNTNNNSYKYYIDILDCRLARLGEPGWERRIAELLAQKVHPTDDVCSHTGHKLFRRIVSIFPPPKSVVRQTAERLLTSAGHDLMGLNSSAGLFDEVPELLVIFEEHQTKPKYPPRR